MRWATAHQRGVLRRAWNSGAAQAMLRCMHTVPHAGDELVTGASESEEERQCRLPREAA